MLEGASLLLAPVCAAIMGLAIQCGATCPAAAVDELPTTQRPTRWLAGWFLGCVGADAVFVRQAPGPSTSDSPLLALPGWWTSSRRRRSSV